ncbi:hypothetical protein AnigIFM60653_009520 [Aspergillus niger]|nr:hypothetical protein AnigIFM60653_009520 [Aspergillus niger]
MATFNYNHSNVDVQNARFCNITITYTHPGYKGVFKVETWLPPHDKWNGILQVAGGGGTQAGRWVLLQSYIGGAIGEGYATTSTDASLTDNLSPASWALERFGDVDIISLQNPGS